MKRLLGYALMLALTAAPALAAKNSQSVSFASPVKVGITEIPAGDCKVTWNGTGDNVQVTLAQKGKTLTIPAKLVAEKHNHKGYIVSRESGSDQLQTIQLSDVSLQLEGATASGR
ncbi:MAG TPA: hypothetical protein VK574_17230 [Terracidiphilus sp.]|nr:hypothetical protein [Terracidiphilus sp.]